MSEQMILLAVGCIINFEIDPKSERFP